MRRSNLALIGRLATLMVLFFVVLGLALNSSGLLDPDFPFAVKVRTLAGLIPAMCFVVGIIGVDRAFRAIQRGEGVVLAMSGMMRWLGLSLFAGGLAFVFVQPMILRWLTDWSAYGWFDVPSITLGCVGLLLVVLAGPLREAGQAQVEMDGIL